MRNFIMAVLLVLFSINGVASAAEDDIFEIEAEGNYRMQAGSSIDLAKKLALFTAKRKAVESAGKYLFRKSLVEVYELNRDEIYSLAAREIRAEILERHRQSIPDAARKEMANHDDLSEPFGKKIPELGQHLYGQSHNSLYFARAGVHEKGVERGVSSG